MTDGVDVRRGLSSGTGPAALLRLLQSHYEPLRRFVERRLRSPDAADIVQDTYVKVAQLDAATEIRNPVGFLYRMASNLSLDLLREREVRERHIERSQFQNPVPECAPDGEAFLAGHQRLVILASAVAELPPRCGEVFRLRKIEHLEPQAIADRLGISRNMVEKHLRKALAHCQARLDEAGA